MKLALISDIHANLTQSAAFGMEPAEPTLFGTPANPGKHAIFTSVPPNYHPMTVRELAAQDDEESE